ncbi:MAG: hypothetical protein LBI03_10245 [Clostridiales bacterium]|jgi:hypothetical protein|nr:hypothetical protein [Clostridiales bacterium]
MTISEAIKKCIDSNLIDWELVAYTQRLVNKNMAYSYDNSFDMPVKAFEKGKGYCWQQAKALQKILLTLGFKCYAIYAIRNLFPETQFEGVQIPALTSGHVWCRVKINGEEKDVCPGNIHNKPGEIHFMPLSKINKWNVFISCWAYWGSAYVNHKRLKEIRRRCIMDKK